MKIIFLDIDGVLNTEKTFYQIKQEYMETRLRRIAIDEYRIKYLKKIVDETNAKIVLSSSWRIFFDKKRNKVIAVSETSKKLVEMLKKYDLEIYDITPNDEERIRQNEIAEWLYKKEIESFVVIDDEAHDLSNYVNKELIKTSFRGEEGGLCERHVEEAIKVLNKPKILKK